MEQVINKSGRIRRSQQEILGLLGEFEKKNVSVNDFCQEHAIGKATFHKWKSRYKLQSEKKKEAKGFARLHITSSSASSVVVLFAEVKGIKIYQPVAASYLKELSLP